MIVFSQEADVHRGLRSAYQLKKDHELGMISGELWKGVPKFYWHEQKGFTFFCRAKVPLVLSRFSFPISATKLYIPPANTAWIHSTSYLLDFKIRSTSVEDFHLRPAQFSEKGCIRQLHDKTRAIGDPRFATHDFIARC